MYFQVMVNESLSMAEGFKMFLSDQKTFNNFNIDGAVFTSYVKKPGLQYHEIKLQVVKNLKDDPQVLCKIYSESKSYAQVNNLIYCLFSPAYQRTLETKL